MPIQRVFLEVQRPALTKVVEYLVNSARHEDRLPLADTIVVLPGRRAGRRLLELLVAECQAHGLLLTPPTIETVGMLPEQLYSPQRPFANELTQDLAWARALLVIPAEKLRAVIPIPPRPDDDDRWFELGQVFRRQHVELAADGLDFDDVARRGAELNDFQEAERWQAMAAVQAAYHRLLDEAGLWDLQTARLVAIREQECRTEKGILVVGTVDMNIATRQMLDQVANRVTALVFAPNAWSDRFDEHGCLLASAWQEAVIPIEMPRVRVVDGPDEQAEAVGETIAQFEGRYRADEITIGAPNESIVAEVERLLTQHELPSRWGPGKPLAATGPHMLLDAIASYLARGHFRDFATLVRHPAVGEWLRNRGVGGDWLTELDEYQAEHLPYQLTGRWLGPTRAATHLRVAFDAIAGLVSPLIGEAKPLHEWGSPILSLLVAVYGDRQLDRSASCDRETLAACEAIRDAVAVHASVPSTLIPCVTAPTATSRVLDQTASQSVPPPADEEAIEILGWLELPLDDAPALIVTSLNEGFVPESVNSDLFLPNRLRSALGLLDNSRRYARDAYALSVILASRPDVTLVVGRRNHEGDPLVPSRLLFASERADVAQRALAFFGSTAGKARCSLAAGTQRDNAAAVLSVPKPSPLEEPVSSMSVTSFRDYIACPYRFYLRHVLKLRPLSDDRDELDGAAFGSLAHEVLRRFGASPERDCSDAGQLRRVLHDLLNQAVAKSFGRDALAVVRVQTEQLRLRLDAFADKQAEWAADGWVIEHTEVPNADHPPACLAVDDQPMTLAGRIDRIDVNARTGKRVVFDYKTSDTARRPRDAHQKRGEWVDLQLPLYRHLVSSLGIEGPVELGYILLPKDTSRVEYCFAKWSDEELAAADALADNIARSVRDERFWPPTDPAPDFFDEFAAICQDHVL